MEINEKKKLLKFLETPKTIYEVCYLMDWSTSNAYNQLNVLVAGKEVKRVKTMGNKIVYHVYKEE